jgi:hypothetical protein
MEVNAMHAQTRIQRKQRDSSEGLGTTQLVHSTLAAAGQPLDSATRATLEPRFGHDFSQVRVHTDTQAAESAQAIQAKAYTAGNDIVFGDGQYAPGSGEGQRLLAHELAHVVQQSAGPVSGVSLGDGLQVSQPGDSFEQAADRAAEAAVSGAAVPAPGGAATSTIVSREAIQRDEDDEDEVSFGPFSDGFSPVDTAAPAEEGGFSGPFSSGFTPALPVGLPGFSEPSGDAFDLSGPQRLGDDTGGGGRDTAVATAEAEAGQVYAKQSGEPDETGKRTRPGWGRLTEYFNTSAPGLWSDSTIKYNPKYGMNGLPHWCGIFALWAVKSAGAPVGTWKMGSGISAVSGIKPVRRSEVRVGDIGFLEKNQHHFLVSAVSEDGKQITSVDGNSGADSEVSSGKTRNIGDIAGFYRAFDD